MEPDELKDFFDLQGQAKEIKEALGLESIDTALLMIIQQDIDQIRFHNC